MPIGTRGLFTSTIQTIFMIEWKWNNSSHIDYINAHTKSKKNFGFNTTPLFKTIQN